MLALKVEKLKCSVEGIVVVVATETVEWVRGSRKNLTGFLACLNPMTSRV